MTASDILSVRVGSSTKRVLSEAASRRHLAGASALARSILDDWAQAHLSEEIAASWERAEAYLKEHPEGWDDDPEEFFKP